MITIPRYIIIDNGIDALYDILLKLNLKNPLVIVGKKTKKYAPEFDYVYYSHINLKDEKVIRDIAKGYDS